MATKIKKSVLIKKLDTIFSQYIRRRYAINNISECFTCGVKNDYKKQQAGHFASRRHYSTRWDERNVGVQCYGCNISRSGEQYKFSQYLGNNLSEELQIKSKQIVKFADIDLIELIDYYTEKVNTL